MSCILLKSIEDGELGGAMGLSKQSRRELGVNAMHLEVSRGNETAFELYRRIGYVDHGRYLMTKWLERKANRRFR